MARKTYDQLIEQNENSFPDNNTGEITEEALRSFHANTLDSAALETDWLNVTDDLSGGLVSGGSITITKCLLKRTGDVILLCVDADMSITVAGFTGATFIISEDIFDMGNSTGQICVFTSNTGKFFKLTCGNEQIVFTAINPAAVASDGFSLRIAFPYIKMQKGI
jgi:hypothetical protein